MEVDNTTSVFGYTGKEKNSQQDVDLELCDTTSDSLRTAFSDSPNSATRTGGPQMPVGELLKGADHIRFVPLAAVVRVETATSRTCFFWFAQSLIFAMLDTELIFSRVAQDSSSSPTVQDHTHFVPRSAVVIKLEPDVNGDFKAGNLVNMALGRSACRLLDGLADVQHLARRILVCS